MEMLTKVSENQIKLEFRSRLAMLMKDMTQTELARKTNLTRQAIAKYCSGKCLPTAQPLYQLANYFNVSCDYLLGREEGTSHALETIIKSIGLTEQSLRVLMNYNSYKDMKYEIAAVNTLLTHSESSDFLIALAKYTSAPNVDADDFDDDVYRAMFPYSLGVQVTPIGMRNEESEIGLYSVAYNDIVYYQLMKEFNSLVESIKKDSKTKKIWVELLMGAMNTEYKRDLYSLYEASVNEEFSLDDIKCDKDALKYIIKTYAKQMEEEAIERKKRDDEFIERLSTFLESEEMNTQEIQR